MKRERVAPARPRKSENARAVDETEADLLADIDDLLEEIDAVLEDQTVLIGFRQRPGQ